MTDGPSIVALTQQASILEAETCIAYAEFDASGEWALDRARTAAAWIASKTHQPLPVVKRRLKLGRSLRNLPAAKAAWLAGEITDAHVGQLVRARTERTAEAMDRDEEGLVGLAKEHTFAVFCRAITYWLLRNDPDGAERSAAEIYEARRVDLDESFQGIYTGEITLDPISGAIVKAELDRLERLLFEDDWAKAKVELGRDPLISELARTSAQRRADALVEMATRSATAPEGGKRPRPLFTVLVGYETLQGTICELANRTVVAPGQLVPWLTRADFERVVFDPTARPIEVGERARLFTGAKRRAIEVRDRECFQESCDEPASKCQADHIVRYTDGGLTLIDNGRMACGFHNRGREEGRSPPDDDW